MSLENFGIEPCATILQVNKMLKSIKMISSWINIDSKSSTKIQHVDAFYRCEIPVIIMGETGCGKTRLIRFLCDLQKPPGSQVQNMILMKVIISGVTILVIIMGETRCGKTRLIRFLCDLQKPPGSQVQNMILMKVIIFSFQLYYILGKSS